MYRILSQNHNSSPALLITRFLLLSLFAILIITINNISTLKNLVFSDRSQCNFFSALVYVVMGTNSKQFDLPWKRIETKTKFISFGQFRLSVTTSKLSCDFFIFLRFFSLIRHRIKKKTKEHVSNDEIERRYKRNKGEE